MIVAGDGGQQLPAPRQKAATEESPSGDGRLADAQQAVEHVRRAKADMRRQRKQAAADKVLRLKQQLQALKAFGGDPAAVTRLARALSGAVGEYRTMARGAAAEAPAAAVPAPAGRDRIEAEARLMQRRLRALAEDQRRRKEDDEDGALAAMDLAVAQAGHAVALDVTV